MKLSKMFKTDFDLGVFPSEGLLEPVEPFVVGQSQSKMLTYRKHNIYHVLLRELSQQIYTKFVLQMQYTYKVM